MRNDRHYAYRITGELGRGGMGIVYLAEDAKLVWLQNYGAHVKEEYD